MNRIKNSFKKGFTLIELLVVLAIVSILIGITLFATSSARKSITDKEALQTFSELKVALEQYKAQCKTYPESLSDSPNNNATARVSGSGATCLVSFKEIYRDAPGPDYVYYVPMKRTSSSLDMCDGYWMGIQLEQTNQLVTSPENKPEPSLSAPLWQGWDTCPGGSSVVPNPSQGNLYYGTVSPTVI